MLGNFQYHVPEHLNEPAVGVKGKPAVCSGRCHPFHGDIVQSEVQDGIHHARHRKNRAGSNGKQQRIRGVAKLLPCFLFGCFQARLDLLRQALRKAIPDFIILTAYFRRNGHARRYRQPDSGHLRQTGALAAEQ